jgi:Uncharacterised protein family (UPF0236)
LKKASARCRTTGEKKTLSKYGKIEIAREHVYSKPVRGYQISPYMQEKMVYVAQMNCYEESSEVLEQFSGVEVNAMQIHRVANTYGSLIEQEALTTPVEIREKEIVSLKEKEVVYAQGDGSMLLTRKEGWKEVKVGRIFKSGDCHSTGVSEERGWIKESEYEAYLGGHREFTRRFENKLDDYSVFGERLVFISDGAEWIKNWITEIYPKATQILDWYHCKEHLCQFAEIYFDDELQRHKWVDEQAALLYESQTEQAIQHIQSLNSGNKEKRKAKTQLLDYYQSNSYRMDYKRYKNMGAGIIGSGAIEAAHRSVIQKRMKLSGQRWSRKGAQNMLQLRVTNLSGHWNHIIDLINEPTQLAA